MAMMTYPTTAAAIPGSKYEGRDDFFFCFNLFKKETDDNGTVHLKLQDDFPVLVNKKEIRDEIAEKTGSLLPTRAELSKRNVSEDVRRAWPKINWDEMYTGAAGAFVHVNDARGQNRLYLLQNSMDKPVNPGRWNTASGLISSRRPDETAFLEATEELGLLLPRNDHLEGYTLSMTDSLPGLSRAFRYTVLRGYDVKRDQEPNIRARLKEKYPEHADKAIVWKNAQTVPFNQEVCRGAVVSMMGREFKMAAHVVVDDQAMSVNMHVPVLMVKPGADYLAVDPEKFGRNAGLFTLAEAGALDTIPAPRDYIEKWASKGRAQVSGVGKLAPAA